jgi:hypothetical protein
MMANLDSEATIRKFRIVRQEGTGGRAIGIEITAPTKTTLAAINRVLKELGQKKITRDEIAPLHAA